VRWLRERILAISEEEASFPRRGFRGGDAPARRHLEQVVRTFIRGYQAALAEGASDRLAARLLKLEPTLRGFAFEGAAMGLKLLDLLTPWDRTRLRGFLSGPGREHTYMVHVGAGWALARLRRRLDRPPAGLDALLGWLAVDGYGFHQGYFGRASAAGHRRVPDRVTGYAGRVFDQGMGRSLWFIEGADVGRIAAAIVGFPAARRADLWSGVGLASAYAGGVTDAALRALGERSGPNHAHVAQGVAFAAKARQRAGNPAAQTELACRILCGMSADEAAGLTDRALINLGDCEGVPAYEVWRGRIRGNWSTESVAL
jgi:hypothetical protein